MRYFLYVGDEEVDGETEARYARSQIQSCCKLPATTDAFLPAGETPTFPILLRNETWLDSFIQISYCPRLEIRLSNYM